MSETLTVGGSSSMKAKVEEMGRKESLGVSKRLGPHGRLLEREAPKSSLAFLSKFTRT